MYFFPEPHPHHLERINASVWICDYCNTLYYNTPFYHCKDCNTLALCEQCLHATHDEFLLKKEKKKYEKGIDIIKRGRILEMMRRRVQNYFQQMNQHHVYPVYQQSPMNLNYQNNLPNYSQNSVEQIERDREYAQRLQWQFDQENQAYQRNNPPLITQFYPRIEIPESGSSVQHHHQNYSYQSTSSSNRHQQNSTSSSNRYQQNLTSSSNRYQQNSTSSSSHQRQNVLNKTAEFTMQEIPRDNKNCTICLDEFQRGCSARRLPCLHIFHSNCIEQWFREQSTCPICKTTVQ